MNVKIPNDYHNISLQPFLGFDSLLDVNFLSSIFSNLRFEELSSMNSAQIEPEISIGNYLRELSKKDGDGEIESENVNSILISGMDKIIQKQLKFNSYFTRRICAIEDIVKKYCVEQLKRKRYVPSIKSQVEEKEMKLHLSSFHAIT